MTTTTAINPEELEIELRIKSDKIQELNRIMKNKDNDYKKLLSEVKALRNKVSVMEYQLNIYNGQDYKNFKSADQK